MICGLLCAGLLATSTTMSGQRLFPPGVSYTDRAGFYQAMDKVSEGMPAAEVRKLLGQPDDVRKGPDELGGLNADELWCYGTDRHMGFPTLGQVCILKGKAFWAAPRHSQTPFKQKMPEPQLRSILKKLYLGDQRFTAYDPAWVIRTANALINLGRPNAVFALEEFGYLKESLQDATELSPVMRAIFELPPGKTYPWFATPNLGDNEVRAGYKSEPRFPMLITDDIPFVAPLSGAIFSSGPELGSADLSQYREFPIRTTHLRPPDDPFASAIKLFASDRWPFAPHLKSEQRFSIPVEEKKGNILEQVLRMVQPVYQPVDFRTEPLTNGLDLPKYHKEFLRLGVHWDDNLQRYVRRDGVTLGEKAQPPIQRWNAPEFNHMKITVVLERRGESSYVNAGYEVDVRKAKSALPEVLRIYDASTGKLIAWMKVGRDNGDFEHLSNAKMAAAYLAGPSRPQQASGGGTTVGLTIPLGTRILPELATRDHVQKGPVLVP